MDADLIVDRLSDYLDRTIDGHDIVDWEQTVADLSKYGIRHTGVRLVFGASSVRSSARPASVMRQEGKHDPKGPQLDPDVPDAMLLIGGFELAQALVRLLLGLEPASNDFIGRGSGYRADLAQLRAAGF
jgi:hypothetical protein